MRMVDPHNLQGPRRKFIRHLKETLRIQLVLNPGLFRIQVLASTRRVYDPLIPIETTNHQAATLVGIGFFHVVINFAHDG